MSVQIDTFKFEESSEFEELTMLPTEIFPNDVADVADVAANLVGLDDAIDPQEEAMQSALASIDQAIGKCSDNPGVLATQEFNEAVRLVRENSQEEWYRIRCRLKIEKPKGILLTDLDKATRPSLGDAPESTAAELIALALDCGELFYDEQSDGKFIAIHRDGVEEVFQIGTKGFVE